LLLFLNTCSKIIKNFISQNKNKLKENTVKPVCTTTTLGTGKIGCFKEVNYKRELYTGHC
jgi:hypothetical protein